MYEDDDLLQLDEVSVEELMEADETKDGEIANMNTFDAINASKPKKAKEPKANQKHKDEMPVTKAGMMEAVFDAMNEMSTHELAALLEAMKAASDDEDKDEDEDEDDDDNEDDKKKMKENYDFRQDLNTLVEADETLSESFQNHVQTIFETALNSKLSEAVDRLETQYDEELTESVSTIRDEMIGNVDRYLDYVVENWMEDNKLAIENGIRTEIAESFMKQLHGVFTEHYVHVPDSKVDLVDELAEKVDQLEESLNRSMQRSIALSEEVESLTRDRIIREAAYDLTETQAERLASLVETLDFENEDSFASRVETVKESYFTRGRARGGNEVLEELFSDDSEMLNENVSNVMSKYLSAFNNK